MGIQAHDIVASSGARLVGPSQTFLHFAFDSRRMNSSVPTCFISITTASNDGHKYIEQAISRGAVAVVCKDAQRWAAQYPGISFIEHSNPIEVLQQWASACRKSFEGPVLAITGSNGKTIVKEWMFQLLGAPENVHRTPGSFNSSIGVPLTLSALQQAHAAAIVEVGIDRPKTMASMCALVNPTFGIFTTLGDAHGEHFENDEEKFAEKWQLMAACQKIAAHRRWIEQAKSKGLHVPEALIWGEGEQWDPSVLGLDTDKDPQIIENKMNAFLGALLLGADEGAAKARLVGLEPLEMRMNLVPARDGGYLLEDTYSSDLESLHWALEELATHHTEKKWAVLSTLSAPAWTDAAKEMVEKYGFDRVWWISNKDQLSQLTAEFSALNLVDTTVLIKGQRRFGMEHFAATLRKQPHPTWAEVNLGAMRRNLQKFRAKLSPSTKTMAMVKADAYGTGILEVARWLENGHIDYLGVAFSQEALLLRAQGIVAPIMVMNAEPTQFKALAQADCEVELFSMDQLVPYLQETASDTVLKIHLKVDTGMHRLGFAPAAVPAVLEELKLHKNIEVVGVFSHLSSAGIPEHDEFTQQQFNRFETALGQVRSHYSGAMGHILNTQGIARFPEREYEMVRLGIGLYGLGTYQGMEPLEEVVQWKCRISQVGEVLPGESVGYSRAFVANRSKRYATLPVGYADGLSRHLSGGKGQVIIGGQACAILGNVCMDMVMVDVSEIAVTAGDEVVIIGVGQGANELAHAVGTIGYEVLTGIGPRVPRFYLKD